MALHVDYLNHASVLVRLGPVALLSDPWLEGDCFSGGWGLCYQDPDAFRRAATATHLWISHWHSDHLHVPSLTKLAGLNPDITVLANVSANFSMLERLGALGFRDVRPLPERRPLQLSDGIEVLRYPTAGIDNMLHLRGAGWSLLNYNDCNLTAAGVRAIGRQLGPIDLLLTNYNYAGKLFRHGSPAQEKALLEANLRKVARLLRARHVVPFASAHYFRTRQSRAQNPLLLTFEDLEERFARDAEFHVLRVGDALELDRPGAAPAFDRRTPPLARAPEQIHDYGESVPLSALRTAADQRCAQVRKGFSLLSRLLPPLHLEISDLDCLLTLDAGRGAHEASPGTRPHVAAHSRALSDWLARRFGDDTFFAGAHFELRDPDTAAIRAWALVTLLEASHLDPRSALGYLGSREGLWFLWCRREEIATSLAPGALRAAEVRL